MNPIYLICALLLLATCARAQTPPPPPAAATPQVIRWQEGAPNTEKLTVAGQTVKAIFIDGVVVWVALSEQRVGSDNIRYDKMILRGGIINLSERRVEITADAFTVEVLQPQPKMLARETADHLARAMERRAKIASALGEMGAAMQNTQSTTTGQQSGAVSTARGNATYSGTYSSTTTTPDYEARRRAGIQSAILINGSLASGADLRAAELKSNTVMPGNDSAGMLIFDRYKKWETAVVRVQMLGTVLDFPFERTQ